MREDRSEERRRKPRADIKIPVDYSSVDAFLTEFSRDINEGGMFVETETPAELDSDVQIAVHLPDGGDPLTLAGRVVWVSDGKSDSPPGMGIEFQDLEPATRVRINEIVRKLRR